MNLAKRVFTIINLLLVGFTGYKIYFELTDPEATPKFIIFTICFILFYVQSQMFPSFQQAIERITKLIREGPTRVVNKAEMEARAKKPREQPIDEPLPLTEPVITQSFEDNFPKDTVVKLSQKCRSCRLTFEKEYKMEPDCEGCSVSLKDRYMTTGDGIKII